MFFFMKHNMKNSEKTKMKFPEKKIQFKSTSGKRQCTPYPSSYIVSSVEELINFPYERNLFLVNRRKSPSIQGPQKTSHIHAKYFLFSNSSKISFCRGISKEIWRNLLMINWWVRSCNSRTIKFSYTILLELCVKKSLQIT